MKFTAHVVRTVEHYSSIEIEADSAVEAAEKVEDMQDEIEYDSSTPTDFYVEEIVEEK